MMHEDKKYEEFDLMFRSAFEDAQEQVPESVWNAVSSRISARRRIIAFTRWASAGAVAAAAALALILAVGRPSAGTIQEAYAPQNGVVAMEQTPQLPEEEVVAIVPQTPSGKAAKAKPSAVPSADAADVKEIDAAVADNTPVQQTGTAQEASKPSGGKKVDESGKWADVYANLMAEDSRASRNTKKNNIAFSLGGNMSSTDPGRTMSGDKLFAAQRADGYTPIRTGVVENSESQYGIPLSLGLSVAWHFTDRLYVSTGVDWTLLTRSFRGIYDQVTAGKYEFSIVSDDITHQQHYIGIPVSLGYTLINTPDVNVYMYGTAEAEKCLSNSYFIRQDGGDIFTYKKAVRGLQYSAGAGIGAEFRLSDHLGLYVDPSFRYYFDCHQPKNLRTDKKYMLDFSAGFRFNF